MARTEQYKEGRTPLHTFRADIDYALLKPTTYGKIGVKVGSVKVKYMANVICLQISVRQPVLKAEKVHRPVSVVVKDAVAQVLTDVAVITVAVVRTVAVLAEVKIVVVPVVVLTVAEALDKIVVAVTLVAVSDLRNN